MLNINTASYGLGALAWLAVGAILAAGWRRANRAGSLLLAASLVNGLWALWFALQSHFELTWASAHTVELARDLAWGLVLLHLLRGGDRRPDLRGLAWLRGLLLAGCAVLALLPMSLSRLAVSSATAAGIQFGGYLMVAVFALWLAEILFRNAHPDNRWRIKFLCFGVGGIYAYDLLLYSDALLFRDLDLILWQARGAANALAAPLIAVAAARNPGFALDASVSRRVVYHGATLGAVSLYLLFMAAAGYYLRTYGGEWGEVLQVTFLFGALLGLLALVFSGHLRARLRVLLSKHFFSYRYDYREQWLNLTRTLSGSRSLFEAREAALRALAAIVESPGGQLWLRDGAEFRPAARWNMPALNAGESPEGALCRFLAERDWVINLEEFRDKPEHYPNLARPAWLDALAQAWLIVPLANQGELRGFAVLATPLARVEVNWEVCDILKTAASQAASHLDQLANASQLAEAQQFAGFHRLSAFVLHDLKNLIAQQSLVVSRAGRHRHNPAFVDDMVHIMEHSVGKMQRLMDLLKSGVSDARPMRFDLAHLVAEAVRSRSNALPVPVLDADSGSLYVHADHDRLLSVLEHLLQNAQEATPDDGNVGVKLRGLDGQALITIEDTGCGMDEHFMRERLFRPFDTTKGDTGMGIGAYESREYARALGGELEVESTPGTGTRITLKLPLAAVAAARGQIA